MYYIKTESCVFLITYILFLLLFQVGIPALYRLQQQSHVLHLGVKFVELSFGVRQLSAHLVALFSFLGELDGKRGYICRCRRKSRLEVNTRHFFFAFNYSYRNSFKDENLCKIFFLKKKKRKSLLLSILCMPGFLDHLIPGAGKIPR